VVSEEIENLVNKILSCEHCGVENLGGNTPFIYSGAEPKIMIVSEVPLQSSFEEDYGREWVMGMVNKRTPKTLFEWLDLDFDTAKRVIFWIQRMNCALRKGQGLEKARSDCSAKYIPRAIEAVNPDLILTIGRPALSWFFKGKYTELVGKVRKVGKTPFVAFPHPSGANRWWRAKYRSEFEMAKTLARDRIKRLLKISNSVGDEIGNAGGLD